MGHAAGIAASIALSRNVRLRDIPVEELQAKLAKQGAIVHRRADEKVTPGDAQEDFKKSIHFSTPGLEPAKPMRESERAAMRATVSEEDLKAPAGGV
jgi:hypothetical protein